MLSWRLKAEGGASRTFDFWRGARETPLAGGASDGRRTHSPKLSCVLAGPFCSCWSCCLSLPPSAAMMRPPLLCGVRRAPARRHLGSGPRRWCHLAAEGEGAARLMATKEVGLTRGTAIVHAVSMMNLARHRPPLLPRRPRRSPLVPRRRRLVFLLPLAAPGGAIVLAQHRWSCPRRLRLVRRQTKTTTLPNLQTSTLR